MIYIVEIKGPGSDRAIKGYEASSMRAALRVDLPVISASTS
jgi:hypothetical protein